ncbi:unnamed protein product [Meloidogyne enterolobii]|uniref:Uncharacterized protein n=1 Tax=Meloidogyne enterolobii TaxID=390850 RepID=A0ACB0ZE18_MELEN
MKTNAVGHPISDFECQLGPCQQRWFNWSSGVDFPLVRLVNVSISLVQFAIKTGWCSTS